MVLEAIGVLRMYILLHRLRLLVDQLALSNEQANLVLELWIKIANQSEVLHCEDCNRYLGVRNLAGVP